MPIYMDTNGSWGDAEGLIIVDDSTWTDDDYTEMGVWNERTLNEFAQYHAGRTPLEYIAATEGDNA
jgi:hypothetical protein